MTWNVLNGDRIVINTTGFYTITVGAVIQSGNALIQLTVNGTLNPNIILVCGAGNVTSSITFTYPFIAGNIITWTNVTGTDHITLNGMGNSTRAFCNVLRVA